MAFKNFSVWLQNIVRIRLILALAALDGIFRIWILPWVETQLKAYSGGIESIDGMIAPSAETLISSITAYGVAGRAFYTTIELTVLLLYPIIYAFFFSILISAILRNSFLGPESKIQRINLVPFIAMLFDLLENILILILFFSFPNMPAPLLTALTITSILKWSFLIFIWMSVMLALGTEKRV